jgi:hypothetical protein
MVRSPWGPILAWESLSQSEQERLEQGAEALDLYLEREWNPASGESPAASLDIGRSSEWSPTMRALLSAWYRDAGWNRVVFLNTVNGAVTVVLEP